jgi:hypothetical protein
MWPSSQGDDLRQYDFLSSDICRTRRGIESEQSTGSRESIDLRCKLFQNNARKWWKSDILLNALSAMNYPVSIECVRKTETNSSVVYSVDKNILQIDASNFSTPFGYRRALVRGLVYAFDNARAKMDYNNIDHLVCTSVRAFNISGECDLWSKWTDYIGEDPLGMDMYSKKQKCIRQKVVEMISMESKSHSGTDVISSMDRVWNKCFRDHWPFTAEPHMDTRFRDSPFVRPT